MKSEKEITENYDTSLLNTDKSATDEMIACGRLKTGELLITLKFSGYEVRGTILLKYPV